MNEKIIILLITTLLLSVGLSGCNSIVPHPDKSKFIGSWKSMISVYTFEEDGALLAYQIKAGTWTVKDDGRVEFCIDSAGGSTTMVYNYVFSENDTKLTLTAPGSSYGEVFTKQ